MWLSIVRVSRAVVIALATLFVAIDVASAQTETRPLPAAAPADAEEGWSFDDIKDVCEAAQFVMISIGLAAALWWFWFRYLPAKKLPRIEFEVDVERIGENDLTWLIEVVALVKNLGRMNVELTELRFTLESVVAERLTAQGGSLVGMNAVIPLLEGEWRATTLVLDAGTQTRRAVAAAVPKTVSHILVTGRLRSAARTEIYDASRLIRLGE